MDRHWIYTKYGVYGMGDESSSGGSGGSGGLWRLTAGELDGSTEADGDRNVIGVEDLTVSGAVITDSVIEKTADAGVNVMGTTIQHKITPTTGSSTDGIKIGINPVISGETKSSIINLHSANNELQNLFQICLDGSGHTYFGQSSTATVRRSLNLSFAHDQASLSATKPAFLNQATDVRFNENGLFVNNISNLADNGPVAFLNGLNSNTVGVTSGTNLTLNTSAFIQNNAAGAKLAVSGVNFAADDEQYGMINFSSSTDFPTIFRGQVQMLLEETGNFRFTNRTSSLNKKAFIFSMTDSATVNTVNPDKMIDVETARLEYNGLYINNIQNLTGDGAVTFNLGISVTPDSYLGGPVRGTSELTHTTNWVGPIESFTPPAPIMLRRTGDLVTMEIRNFNTLGNDVSQPLSNVTVLPSAWRPFYYHSWTCWVVENGLTRLGMVDLWPNGQIEIWVFAVATGGVRHFNASLGSQGLHRTFSCSWVIPPPA